MSREGNAISLGTILAVGAGVVGGVWFVTRTRGKRADEAPPASPSVANDNRVDRGPPSGAPANVTAVASELELPPGRWIWPLPRWQGRAPVISDGWGSPRDGGARSHRGVDLMYRRRHLLEHALVFPPARPHSKWHFLPPGTVALAAAAGTIWSSGKTPRGYTVVLSHGRPWATYYTHLASLLVPETQRGAGGYRVEAGQPLGVVGVDPTNPKIAHLHFAIWKGGAEEAAIDPAPILARLPAIDPPAPAVRMVA